MSASGLQEKAVFNVENSLSLHNNLQSYDEKISDIIRSAQSTLQDKVITPSNDDLVKVM